MKTSINIHKSEFKKYKNQETNEELDQFREKMEVLW